jgi:hypothetical protein
MKDSDIAKRCNETPEGEFRSRLSKRQDFGWKLFALFMALSALALFFK